MGCLEIVRLPETMKLSIVLMIITLACYTNAMSLEFSATETPNGVLNYGKQEISSVCDLSRECYPATQSRSQCNRWNCCWNVKAKNVLQKSFHLTTWWI